MPALTEELVRTLAAYRSDDAPVVSCFLDVDGRQQPTHLDIEKAFDRLVRRAGLANGHAVEVHPSVRDDVRRMRAHVQGLGRAGVRGLAMFSCSAEGLWQIHELPVRVPSRMIVNRSPYVRPLEELLDEYQRFGVLLADRQRARMFVYEMGELVDHSEAFDHLERHGKDDRGERVKTRVEHQMAEQHEQHLRKAAQLAFAVHQNQPFDRLLLGGPAEVVVELERLLHPYLRERLADRVHIAANAPADQVRTAAHEAEERIERRNESVLVGQLRDEVGRKGRGAAGLAATLKALNEKRVERLFVSSGITAEGWHCDGCGTLATLGRRCPACGDDMVHCEDILEEAVEVALTHHCRVEVCVGNADLDVMGGVGALLRY
ncbi:MAG TPA: hypothetical protein VF855_11170 [Acidimicrobiales bacterium]